MLKNIDPLLAPELLKVLCEMGHGDAVVLADANFTAESLGRCHVVLRLPGADPTCDNSKWEAASIGAHYLLIMGARP